MIKRAAVLGLGLIGALAFAQTLKPGEVPTRLRIDPPGKSPWVKSKTSLAQIATKVGAATKGLQNTSADLIILVQTPEGQGYFTTPTLDFRVMGGKLYRVDYVVLHEVPFSASTANDGKRRTLRLDDKIIQMAPDHQLNATRLKGSSLVRLFETDFPRMMFQGLTDGVDAWKPVLTAWGAGLDGYKTTVEERTMKHQGQTFRHYRIHAQRTGAAVKTLGQSTFEIVIDASRYLPVTVRHVRVDPKGKTWAMMWTASFRFKQHLTLNEMVIGNRKN